VAVAGTSDIETAARLAPTLAGLGHRVSLIVRPADAVRARGVRGVDVVPLPDLDVEVSPGFLAGSYALYQFLREGGFDAVVFNLSEGPGYCTARAKQLGQAFAATVLVQWCTRPPALRGLTEQRAFVSKGALGRAITERLALELADSVVLDDQTLLDWMRADGWALPPRSLFAPGAADPGRNEEVWRTALAPDGPARNGDGENARPLVTVVVPRYERTTYLPHCLDGLARQSYPALEVVIADDGSPSRAAAAQLAELEARSWPWPLRVLRLPRGGVGAARNAAWRTASGELVAFVDDDDVAFEELVEVLVRGREASGVDVVAAGARFFRGDAAPRPQRGDVVRIPLGEPRELGLFSNQYGPPTCVWPRELLHRLGGFSEAQGLAEDWELLARATAGGARVAGTPDPLYWYRQTAASRFSAAPLVHRDETLPAIAGLFAATLPDGARLMPLLATTAYEELERRKREARPRHRALASRGGLLVQRARHVYADEGLRAVLRRGVAFLWRRR
jgi:GT2 family glycosyltransferase